MTTLPKVSAILPVGYGDRYFMLALDCFLNQTYEGEIEVIVVDNSTDSIQHLLPTDERIKYYRCERMPVGALRNLGTSHSTGDVCISADEDDWSSTDRVAAQVARLLESGKAVTGWHSIYYYDMTNRSTYKYSYEPAGRNHPPYAMGTSHCYMKSFWAKYPYPDSGVEDYGFQLTALHLNQLDSCDAGQLCVARAHADSQCPPQFGHKQFPAVAKSDLPNQFYSDIRNLELTKEQ
jgi:glycosyltransferase involved in cell wall biosynthesis